MGRKRNIFIREFFIFESMKNESTCKTCKCKIVGNHVTNLKRHMLANHMELYNQEREDLDNYLAENEGGKKFSVCYSEKEIRNACLKIVTENSQPLSFFDSQAFKILTDQIFQGLNMCPIRSHNIITIISDEYERIKDMISRKIKGKVLSLKMDSATRNERSVLGINIQLIVDGKIEIYTLSIREMRTSQAAQNLKEHLQEVLNEFGITKKQIFSITTDNGRNMLKSVDLLGVYGDDDDDDNDDDDEDEDNGDNNITQYSENSVAENQDSFWENIFEEHHQIYSVRCAAHTLQLAIHDFLRNDERMEIIHSVRQIVKTLRTQQWK